jgi:hypothetical protein
VPPRGTWRSLQRALPPAQRAPGGQPAQRAAVPLAPTKPAGTAPPHMGGSAPALRCVCVAGGATECARASTQAMFRRTVTGGRATRLLAHKTNKLPDVCWFCHLEFKASGDGGHGCWCDRQCFRAATEHWAAGWKPAEAEMGDLCLTSCGVAKCGRIISACTVSGKLCAEHLSKTSKAKKQAARRELEPKQRQVGGRGAGSGTQRSEDAKRAKR